MRMYSIEELSWLWQVRTGTIHGEIVRCELDAYNAHCSMEEIQIPADSVEEYLERCKTTWDGSRYRKWEPSEEARRVLQPGTIRLITRQILPAKGFVYFITEPDSLTNRIHSIEPVKIGWAIDPDKRLSALRTGCPFELAVEARLRAEDRIVEKILHREFRDDALRGEWFRPSRAIRAFVGALNSYNSLQTETAA